MNALNVELDVGLNAIFILAIYFSLKFHSNGNGNAYLELMLKLPFMLKLQLFIFLLERMPKHLLLQFLLLF